MKFVWQWNALSRVAAASVVFLFFCIGCVWSAPNLDDTAASIASNGIMPFVAAGEMSLLLGSKYGKDEALQGAKALFATGIATEALKLTVREKRPESDSTSSFPSGHTAEAFAMATTLADYHPKYALLAYTGAAVVGWSRVEEREHRWRDVIAGALLGHFIAKKFTSKHFGVTPDGIGYHTSF